MRKAGDNGRKIYEEELLRAFMVAKMPTDKVQDQLIETAAVRETSEMIGTMFSTDVPDRMRDLLGDISVSVLVGMFIGAMKSDDIGNMVFFRLLMEKILSPLLAENESLRTMVRTLTVSKEISKAQEEGE